MNEINIFPKNNISGIMTVPGDKSISHRAAILGAIAEGITEITGFLVSKDTMATVNCLRQLGVKIEIGQITKIHGVGLYGLQRPKSPLNCGNSGTTMRLLAGLLAGQKFDSVLIGDESLQSRPMERIIRPLSLMGAKIESNDGRAPLKIRGMKLNAINYQMTLHSAQVKSTIRLASLYARGHTEIIELKPGLIRNHTENLLFHMGYPNTLQAQKITIPGDFSSAAFFIVAGLILAKDGLTIENVGLNPTRIGLLAVLKAMGGLIEVRGQRSEVRELVGDIYVQKSGLRAVRVQGDEIPLMIDELPILAVAAAFACGTTVIKDAAELKVKESNRLNVMVGELSKLGVDIHETADGMIIHGGKALRGANLDSHGDHRIAMALAIAASAADGANKADGVSTLKNADCVNISFPSFFEVLTTLTKCSIM
jgi:3-phosphoshikimate 1-carboxyvinyltransferase